MKLFSEGGPLNVRHRGGDQYDMSVSIPNDADGMTARECFESSCSPGYFKVKGGTGLQGQATAFCPYCRGEKEPNGFITEAQLEYAKALVKREAVRGIQNALGSIFKNSPRPNRNSFLTVSWEYKPGSLPFVASPAEESLKREVTCPHLHAGTCRFWIGDLVP